MAKLFTEERIALTMSSDQVARVDDWRRGQTDLPSKAEAIRRLCEIGLALPPQADLGLIRRLVEEALDGLKASQGKGRHR